MDSPGAYACLRRLSEAYAEIVLRIYPRFVLRDGFFTPGQFTGSLVVDRANRRQALGRYKAFLTEALVDSATK